jgi:alkylation response protein AidB-like acyl-CoA dehydrogenase
LELTDEQQAVRDRLHPLAQEELRSAAAVAERDGMDLAPLLSTLESVGVGPASLLGPGPADLLTVLVAVEELAYGDPGIAWAAAAPLQAALLVAACGDESQRQKIRALFAENPAAKASVLLYEDFGRAPSEYETTATRRDGAWTIEGRKTSVCNPCSADVSMLVARDPSSTQLTTFVYTGAHTGIEIQRDDRATGKLAITAVPTGPVALRGLALGEQQRLAADALEQHRAVNACRLLLAAALLGCARASVEFTAAYAVERTTWGTPIAEYQGVSFPLVEHLSEVTEVRLLLWDLATRIPRSEEPEEIESETSRTVSRASAVALRSVRDGVQLIGVRGITRDLPSERWYRSAGVLGAIDFDPLQVPLGLC